MSVTKEQVELGYQFLLGRRPSTAEIERMMRNQGSIEGMRRTFLSSPEFVSAIRQHTATESVPVRARTIIHLHVPKTAGTTLSLLLAKARQTDQYLSINDQDRHQLRQMPGCRRRDLKFVFGHLSHGVAREFAQPCHYVSVLRRPGPRILSFFRYVQRTDHHPLNDPVTRHGMRFGDFLQFTFDRPQFRTEVDNGQIRRLAGKMQATDLGKEPDLLRRALQNITAPDFTYGLSENFEAFQKRLVQQGLLSSVSEARKNAAPAPGNIDAELEKLSSAQRRIYERYTAWDGCFYDICAAMLKDSSGDD